MSSDHTLHGSTQYDTDVSSYSLPPNVAPLTTLIFTLIDSLQPAFRSSTTEAMKSFAEKFFAYEYDVKFEDAQAVLFGINGKHGLLKAVGRTNFTGSLRSSSAYALELLAKLVSQQTNPRSHATFLAVAQTLDEKGLEALRLNDHLKHGHVLSTKDAALRFINLLKTAPVTQKVGQLKIERRVVPLREAKEAVAAATAQSSQDSENDLEVPEDQQRSSAMLSTVNGGGSSTRASQFPRSSSSDIAGEAALASASTPASASLADDHIETKSQKSDLSGASVKTSQGAGIRPSIQTNMTPELSSNRSPSFSDNQLASLESKDPPNSSKPSSFKSALKSLKTRLFNRESREDLLKKSLLKDELFGRDLNSLVDSRREGDETKNFVNENGIPLFLTTILEYISSTPEILSTEGIFRIPGTPEGTLELKQIINAGRTFDPQEWDVHAMTGVVKQWLRELPTPIIPFELYDPLIDAFKGGDASLVRQLLGSIAAPAVHVIRMIIGCLAKVSTASASNGMTDQSLSIVMAPNLFRPKVQVYAKMIQEMPATIGVIQLAIRDHISGVFVGEFDKVHAVTSATTGTIMGATMRINAAVAQSAATISNASAPGTPNVYSTARLPSTPTSTRNAPANNQATTPVSLTSPDFFMAPGSEQDQANGRGNSFSSNALLPPRQSSQVFHVSSSQAPREQLPPDVLAAVSAANSATAANLARVGVAQGSHQNANLLNINTAHPMRRARHTAVGFGGGSNSSNVHSHHSSAFAFRPPGHPQLNARHNHSSSMNFNTSPEMASRSFENVSSVDGINNQTDIGPLPTIPNDRANEVNASEVYSQNDSIVDSSLQSLPSFTRPLSLSVSSRPRKLAPSPSALALEAAAAAAATAAMSKNEVKDKDNEEMTQVNVGADTHEVSGENLNIFPFSSEDSRDRVDSLSSVNALDAPVLSKVMSSPQNPPAGSIISLSKSSSFDIRHRDSLGNTSEPRKSIAEMHQHDSSKEETERTSSDLSSLALDDIPPPPPPPPSGFEGSNTGNITRLESTTSVDISTIAPQNSTIDSTATTAVNSIGSSAPSRRVSTIRRGSRLHREPEYPLEPEQELAQGWSEFVDVSGAKYFYHTASNAASWIRPCAANKHLVQLRPAVRSRRPTALAVAYPTAAADALKMYKLAGGEALYEGEDTVAPSDANESSVEALKNESISEEAIPSEQSAAKCSLEEVL